MDLLKEKKIYKNYTNKQMKNWIICANANVFFITFYTNPC
jgi:hypothetical protein